MQVIQVKVSAFICSVVVSSVVIIIFLVLNIHVKYGKMLYHTGLSLFNFFF